MSDVSNRISLSTCWCSDRHTDGYEMIKEMASLGFKRVELSHGIRMSLVPGILRAIEEKLVDISSVHNFCPLPAGIHHAAPNLFQPSALNQHEKISWSRYTLQTLDFAASVGASKVVMHSGSVGFFFQSPEKRLSRWIKSENLQAANLLHSQPFKNRRDRVMKRIRKASKATMQRIKTSYDQAKVWAGERNLKLGIENREGLEEMPLDGDFIHFIESLSAPAQIGYWHDTGHAQIKHQLGLLDHHEHLRALQNHLIGFHLHDVTEEGEDHQPIGTGTIDFDRVARFIQPEHELVLELNSRVSSAEVIASRTYICELLN